MSETSAPLLSVSGIETYYGNIVALRGVDIDVHRGEIVTLIGANGAGKSTLMMTICGNPRARHGQIVYDGTDITAMPTHEIMRLGIAQSPEGRRIFPRMTVMENLQMGAQLVDDKYFDDDVKRVFDLFPRLKERQVQRGGTLSGGEQQMLAIGRALMTNPRLLVLDEATEGLAPAVRQEIWRSLHRLKTEGLAILVIDKSLAELSTLVDRYVIIEKGANVWEGKPAELTADIAARHLGVAG